MTLTARPGADPSAGAPTLAAFQAALGSTFWVTVETSAVEVLAVDLTLRRVEIGRPRPGWESFSLLFARSEQPVPQGTHTVDHPVVGRFSLFLVPVVADAEGNSYEAVFNRPSLVDAASAHDPGEQCS